MTSDKERALKKKKKIKTGHLKNAHRSNKGHQNNVQSLNL